MKEGQIKVYLDSSTYITKVNGKTVMVRSRHQLLSERQEKFSNICADLLRGILSKYKRQKMKSSQIPRDKSASARNPTNPPFQGLLPLPIFNPNSNLIGSASAPSAMGPVVPQPGIYRFGDRQMALLPLTSQGSPGILPLTENPYPQQPWVFPLPSSTMGFNFPPTGTDAEQFTKSQAAGEASLSVTKHVCAECGRLRSRKYQHENPLKAGETPTPAFCKKCQRDMTSTEESETSTRTTEKQHKRSTGRTKASIKNEGDMDSSEDSICSDKCRKCSKVKVKKSRGKASVNYLNKGELREKTIVRHMSSSSDNDSRAAARKQHSSPVDQVSSNHSRSTNSSLGYTEGKQRKEIAKNVSRSSQETRQQSPVQLVATAAETSRHIRHANTSSRYENSDTDSITTQLWGENDSVSSEMISNQVSNFEDPTTIPLKTRSKDSSRRRRLERISDHRKNVESPRSTRPPMDDKTEMVTERNIHRSRGLPPPEENLEYYKVEAVERATGETRESHQQLTADAEALDYYRNDWARVSEQNKGAQRRLRQKDLEKLESGAEYQSSSRNSSSVDRERDDVRHLSRTRKLPMQVNEKGKRHSRQQLSVNGVRYLPTGSRESSVIQKETHIPACHQDLANQEELHPYERPYVRDATDRGTEALLESFPKQDHKGYFNPEANESELTEEIERVDRHVTFLSLDRYNEGHDITSVENLPARALRKEGR